jgi:5'-nucleotidase
MDNCTKVALKKQIYVISNYFFSILFKIKICETYLGNFVTDVILSSVKADCCIINGGTFRSDSVHPKGSFKLKDLKSILPYETEIVVIEATGKRK